MMGKNQIKIPKIPKNPKLKQLKIRNRLPSLTSKLIKWTKIKKGKHENIN